MESHALTLDACIIPPGVPAIATPQYQSHLMQGKCRGIGTWDALWDPVKPAYSLPPGAQRVLFPERRNAETDDRSN